MQHIMAEAHGMQKPFTLCPGCEKEEKMGLESKSFLRAQPMTTIHTS
jgi:hypothetical protein